jgi:simple sugar transport system permease protein
MLNWIAFYFTDFLIQGPYKSPSLPDQTNSLPPQTTLPLISTFYNQTLGKFLPQIANPVSYFVDVSFFAALVALVVYSFITRRTAFGYEIRVIGQNPKAAAYAGIPIKRNIILTMAIAGAFAGLAGAFRLMGQSPYQLIAMVFSSDPTGFDAIGVALLGRTTSIGILFSSLLFGGLRQGSSFMQLNAGVPADLVLIIQALILFSIASEFLPAIQLSLPGWARLSRRPALATGVIGQTDVEVPLSEIGTAGNGEATQQTQSSPDIASVAPERNSDRVEGD